MDDFSFHKPSIDDPDTRKKYVDCCVFVYDVFMAGRRCIFLNRKSKLNQRKIKKENAEKKAHQAILAKKRKKMKAFHSQFRAAISGRTKKKFIAVCKKIHEKHPQLEAAKIALRDSIKTDYETHIAEMPPEDKPLLRAYKGETNLQRTKTKYHQHLYEWFEKTVVKQPADPTKTPRDYKGIVFGDRNYEIDLGRATNFKGAGELLETAHEMAI